MQFKVLGPVEVAADGVVRTPRPAKLRALLALLCVNAGSVVSREQLEEALWCGSAPRTARAALQVYVSKLRKYFDTQDVFRGSLVTKPHGYELHLDPSDLDLAQFDKYVRRSAEAVAGQRLADGLADLRAACALWRGPALADLRGNPTFDNLARQLDERRIDATERRFNLHLEMGQHRAIISELCGLTAERPTWESIHAQLMIALYRSGRVSEALQVFRKIRDALVSELGLEPGEEIQTLHRSMLVRDPALREDVALSRAY